MSVKMDISTGGSSPEIRSNDLSKEGSEETPLQGLEMDSSFDVDHNYQFQSMSALDILRECVRILRFNSWGFMGIMVFLICPVSAVLLSNILVSESIVKRFSMRLMLVAKTSGLSVGPTIRNSCHHVAETVVSSIVCFPLYITLLLLSKAAVVYTVHCTYLRKLFDASKFYVTFAKTWRRIVSTYTWACTIIAGCIILFFVFIVAFCSALSVLGFSQEIILYAAMMMGLVFSVVFANAIIICNLALVISILEDISGSQAMVRSRILIKGQTQVGLMILLISTAGMAFVDGLFEHRVTTVSYGDGSSRMWEGPLLVIMYSFVVLVDSMMNAVFYFSCKSFSKETLDDDGNSILDCEIISAESMGIQ